MSEISLRIKSDGDRAVPLYPGECEPHTPSPDGYLQWHAWAEQLAETHMDRQCKGCGLWAIWEPKPAETVSGAERAGNGDTP